jgi:hypothetical protein
VARSDPSGLQETLTGQMVTTQLIVSFLANFSVTLVSDVGKDEPILVRLGKAALAGLLGMAFTAVGLWLGPATSSSGLVKMILDKLGAGAAKLFSVYILKPLIIAFGEFVAYCASCLLFPDYEDFSWARAMLLFVASFLVAMAGEWMVESALKAMLDGIWEEAGMVAKIAWAAIVLGVESTVELVTAFIVETILCFIAPKDIPAVQQWRDNLLLKLHMMSNPG